MKQNIKVVIKGGGDLGSGAAHRLFISGIRVIILDREKPSSIRRHVCFSEAIYKNEINIEGVRGKRIAVDEIDGTIWDKNFIPVIANDGSIIKDLNPDVIVDATLRGISNKTVKINDAPVTIGIGPGFCAGKDLHYVIETQRGHYLGSVITEGEAITNTGIPGNIGGYTFERVLWSPCAGTLKYNGYDIGSEINVDEIVCYVDSSAVVAKISGVIRGLAAENLIVRERQKIGDIDPRSIAEYAFTISDKARAIGGGVLEAVLRGINNL